MTTKTIDIHETQPQLSELLPLVTAGTEVIFTEGNMPVARLVPVAGAASSRVPGLHLGKVWMSPDFDAPLPDEFWTGAA
jgi:antitoxin (DNA-binding transcriptional repressor) of toxin-antitoxin stability system